jgi:hypothetical protein
VNSAPFGNRQLRVGRSSLAGPFLCLLLVACSAAHATAHQVIAPAQEQLLAEMVGRGEVLPGGCTFTDGQVESTLVRSTFRCAAGTVVIELCHPSEAADAVATTDRFAIRIVSGTPAPELIAALVARVREREQKFVWGAPGALAGAGSASPFSFIPLDSRMIQAAWVILLIASPFLCWRGARAVGIPGARMMVAVSLPVILAAAVIWNRPDEPLHANGHAWREAREVLAPWGSRSTGAQPFLHGQGGIALQWLLAAFQQKLCGSANPFVVSRWAGAAAAGATAFLAIVLIRSSWAGLAAGCVLALMPLAQMLAVSGSPLAIAAWMLPWTHGLLIAAGRAQDRFLLAGATLAAALGILSHTAMLPWPAALIVVWLVTARRRFDAAALCALLVVTFALVFQLSNVFDMIAGRNQGPSGGLLGEAWRGAVHRNLMTDPRWTSPLLMPLVLLWLAAGFGRRRRVVVLASVVSLVLVAAPFFAVTQSSSDAVRYQGALLGLITGQAVAGVWNLPLVKYLGVAVATVMRSVLLATLVVLPTASQRPPKDPVAVEHQLVADAAGRLEPGALVILPQSRFEQGRIIADFPDFLLPADSHVVTAEDPRAQRHTGRRFVYLGLACISWDDEDASKVRGMRPECQALRRQAQPWIVRTLGSEDLPRSRDGAIWTFHRLSVGVPFGFFELEPAGE